MSATAALLTVALIVSVVDGDTVKVRPTPTAPIETVRLIGIDTPETKHPRLPVQCFGPEASAEAKRLLAGKRVVLERDPSQGDRDRYGRKLRYVWRGNTLINEQLVRGGFAREYTYRTSYRYQWRFRDAQRLARGEQRGLWGKCYPPPPPPHAPTGESNPDAD